MLSSSKLWAKLSSFEYYIGPSCLWANFWPLGQVDLGLVLCGPSLFSAKLSCTHWRDANNYTRYYKIIHFSISDPKYWVRVTMQFSAVVKLFTNDLNQIYFFCGGGGGCSLLQTKIKSPFKRLLLFFLKIRVY